MESSCKDSEMLTHLKDNSTNLLHSGDNKKADRWIDDMSIDDHSI